jgi:hypothetical protein
MLNGRDDAVSAIVYAFVKVKAPSIIIPPIAAAVFVNKVEAVSSAPAYARV